VDAGTYAGGSYQYEQEAPVSSAPQFAEQERATAAPYSPEPMQPPQQPTYTPGPTPPQTPVYEQPTHSPFETPAQSPFTPQPPLSSSPTPQHSPFEAHVAQTPTAPPPSPHPTPPAQDFGSQVVDTGVTMDLSAYKRMIDEQTKPFVAGSIVFTSGALQGQAFEIPTEGLFIGRDSGAAQIVIADPRVSKCHLWIGPRDRKVVIQDQESRNGTFVNDTSTPRITQVELQNGDVVILGEASVAQFEYRASQ
jgi:hypothetical protein